MEKENKMTVGYATRIAYNEMGVEFHILNLVRRVREITERPHLTDGTITRQLRKLREYGVLDYEIANQRKAIYRKQKETPEAKNQLNLFKELLI